MAAANVIDKALTDVMGHAYKMENLLQVLDSVNGELGQCPPWVQMMLDHYCPLHEAIEALEAAIGREALPRLRDFDAAMAKGGMGALAPMVTTVMAGQSAPSRT